MGPARAPLLCLALVGCQHIDPDRGPATVSGFEITFADDAVTGSPEAPLDFPSAVPATVRLDVTALRADGRPFAYSGRARVQVVPGTLDSAHRVRFIDGVAWSSSDRNCAQGCAEAEVCDDTTARCLSRGVDVSWRFSFGRTHVWVEDAGEDPGSDCENGEDDDGDGLADQLDPDCLAGAEGASPPATYATGISGPLYFAQPRIRDLQFSPRCTTDTPLGGQGLTIGTGTLVVTGTTQSGMYVTDLSGEPGGYNSVYLFTFSNPGDVRRGDRLCSISGNAAEFIGNTQLNFPSFENADTNRNGEIDPGDLVPCDLPEPERIGPEVVPEPVVLTATDLVGAAPAPTEDFYLYCHPDGGVISGLDDPRDCQAARGALSAADRRRGPVDCARDNFLMEPHEHALIAFDDLTISTRFEKCDFNDDGRIERRGGDEGGCEEDCTLDPLCTERISLEQFGQFAVGVGCTSVDPPVCDGKINVSTRDTLGGTGYDPEAHPGERYARVVGHLRQLQPGAGVPTTWILEPRFLEDFIAPEGATP